MRALALAAVALTCAAGCSFGGGDEGGARPRADDSGWTSYAPLNAEPPRKLDPGFPPPAWVETKRGRFWLGYFTFCWKAGCWDYVLAPDACEGDPGRNDPPRIPVEDGETLRFHLEFEPRELRLDVVTTGAPTTARRVSHRLDAAGEASWRAKDAVGAAILFAAAAGGDASYVACFVEQAGP